MSASQISNTEDDVCILVANLEIFDIRQDFSIPYRANFAQTQFYSSTEAYLLCQRWSG